MCLQALEQRPQGKMAAGVARRRLWHLVSTLFTFRGPQPINQSRIRLFRSRAVKQALPPARAANPAGAWSVRRGATATKWCEPGHAHCLLPSAPTELPAAAAALSRRTLTRTLPPFCCCVQVIMAANNELVTLNVGGK